MEDYNIIESEDEDITFDIDELLSSDETASTEESSSEYYTIIDRIYNYDVDQIKETIFKKINYAIEKKIPINFVYIDEEGNIINLLNRVRSMNIEEAYIDYAKKNNIDANLFILIYYWANKNLDKNTLIREFNKLEKLTDNYYQLDNFETYKQNFDNMFKSLVEKNIKDYNNIERWYSNLEELQYSFNVKESFDTLSYNKTNISYYVKELDYDFAYDIFDSIKLQGKFIYSQMNIDEKKLYKIYETGNVISYIDIFSKIMEEENSIYLIYLLDINKKLTPILIRLDLFKSTVEYEFPQRYNVKINKDLSKLLKDFTFQDEKINFFSGSIIIDIDNFDETKLYYLINTDKLVSEILYINEDYLPRSLQSKVKYYYKQYSISNTRYNISFSLEKLVSDKYQLVFKTKEVSPYLLIEFINTLSKIFWYYQNIDLKDSEYDIISLYYDGGKGAGLGGKPLINYEEKEDKKKKRIKDKKLDLLLNRAPKVFPRSNYGRICSCPKQPIIIDKEDVEDWKNYTDLKGKKHNVLLFPPENSKQKAKKLYYVCPGDNSVLSFIRNTDKDSEYPILPCCTSTTSKDFLYKDYEEIRKDPTKYFSQLEEKKGKTGHKIKTSKILAFTQYGEIPDELSLFLSQSYPKDSFVRYGIIQNSKNSLIHIAMIAAQHLSKIKIKNEKEKIKNEKILELRKKFLESSLFYREVIVQKFRKEILNYCKAEIVMQENYDLEIDQVKNILLDIEEEFDSQKFFRIIEQIFKINLIIFSFDSDQEENIIEFEQPNHINFSIRNLNRELPNVLVLKHTNKNIYELIKIERRLKDKEKDFLFDDKILNSIEDIIDQNGYYNYQEYTIRKNEYNDILWPKILSNYQIIGQSINSNGRTYMINILLDDNEKMSIFVPPTPPLDCDYTEKVYSVKKEKVFSIFGKNFVSGSQGIWYEINGVLGVFVPCKDVNKKKYFICDEFLLNTQSQYRNIDLEYMGNIKKNSNIIKQLFIFLWNLSSIEKVEDWFEKYVIVTDNKGKINNILSNISISLDYKFPNNLKSTEEGIQYLEKYIPYIFKDFKISIYEDFANKIKQYLFNYAISTEGIAKMPNKSIINIYNKEDDFKKYALNKIIMGKDNYDIWANNMDISTVDVFNIKEEYVKYKELYPYINSKNNLFLIQNNEEDLKISAILNSLVWKETGYNFGYEITPVNFWKIFKDYPSLTSLFNINILYIAEKKIGQFYEDIDQAIDALVKNFINFELPEEFIDYKIFSNNGVINKNIKSDEYVNIWMYENGAYASMLSLL